MTTTKRYITETTDNGKTERVEKIVYVAKDGEEFSSAQEAYRHDIAAEMLQVLGPAVDPYKGRHDACDYYRDTGRQQGMAKAIARMLDMPDVVVNLLQRWQTNRNS